MQFVFEHIGAVLLLIAAVGWYVCVLIGTAMLTAGRDTPGLRAEAAWICNVPIVLLALAMDRYEIAVGMIFSTSVASLTLVLGVVTLAAKETTPQLPRRAWGMILPVALICLLIGMSGGFGWKHAAILLVQGFAVLMVWHGPADESEQGPKKGSLPAGRSALMLIVVVGATSAAGAGVLAAMIMGPRMGMVNAGLITALMLAPAMVLPQIGIGLQAAHDGKYDQFVGGLIGFVILNLCLLLPMATMLWLAQPVRTVEAYRIDPTTAPSTMPSTIPTTQEAPQTIVRSALPYPMAVWRVDTALLVAVGLLLLPVSMGRWSLGHAEGLGLVLTYAIFMILTVLVTMTHWL